MNPRDSKIIDLMVKYVRREKLTVEEMQLLEEFWKQSPGHQRLAEEFGNEEWVRSQLADMEPAPVEEMWQEIDKYLDEIGAPDDRELNPILLAEETGGEADGIRTGVRRQGKIVFGIAASLAVCMAGVWIFNSRRQSVTTKPFFIAAAAVYWLPIPEDDKVLVQASDGSVVEMNPLPTQKIVMRTGTDYTEKLDADEVGVFGSEENQDIPRMPDVPTAKAVVWQTVYVGKQHARFLVRLRDGSTVWLKGGTRLRYPVGPKEQVEHYALAGTGYFEVVKNHLRGMEVETIDGGRIDVLGTVFNVEADGRGSGTVVSLVEGSVEVHKGAGSRKLEPGDEAVIGPSNIDVHSRPDPAAAMAWIGDARLFHFENTDFDSAIAKVAAWYRLSVAPHTAKGMAIDATVPKERTPDRVLQDIQEAGSNRVYVWLEGSVIHISDKPK
ncbi:MAG TPA: FecR family protein [Puia sp.]|nr:FecR family protein [Puia sp.]